MMPIFCFLLLILQMSESKECPAEYRLLSDHHSYCLPRKPSCKIFSSGIRDKKEIDEILKIHNTYRSKIAMGLVNEKGNFTTSNEKSNYPKASDMMEMVWDDELSATAQKWAEQCDFNHDCRDCRAVPSYRVGQNLGLTRWTCSKSDCYKYDNRKKRAWSKTIKGLFDEIIDCPKSLVKSYDRNKIRKMIGHFTQIIWARTWRIGCGYVSYEHNRKFKQLYACNYGPVGNVDRKPIYIKGDPCTKCPVNSCCGHKCNPPTLPGLCKLLPGEIAPRYSINKKGLLLYCNFEDNDKCPMFKRGVDKWKNKSTHSGTILSIILKGGESSALEFHKRFNSKHDNFCLRLLYSKGPSVAGLTDSNRLALKLESDEHNPIKHQYKKSTVKYFTNNLGFPSVRNMNMTLTYSVPKGSPPQFLKIKEISIHEDRCPDD